MKKSIILIFILLIYLPAFLFLGSKISGRDFDITLTGNYDVYDRPELTLDSYLSGDFQNGFTNWFGTSFKPNRFFTKLCQSINFYVFRTGVLDIGRNNSIFVISYLEENLAFDNNNYALDENRLLMEDYVNKLQRINDLLNSHGKSLLVYTCPGKPDFYEEDIPWNYRVLEDEERVSAHDLYRELLDGSTVPHLFLEDISGSVNYPLYYPTGVHWSRPYEQLATNTIISELSDITGNNYRLVVLGDVNSNNTGFWRDNDVLDMMNVWADYGITYYEHQVSMDFPSNFEHMRLLISGDSFAQGFTRDLEVLYPNEEIYYVNYDNYVNRMNYPLIELNHDFNNFDFQYYLDNVDAVVIESAYANLFHYSSGFVDALLSFLETYEEGESSTPANYGLVRAAGLDGDFSEEKLYASNYVIYNVNEAEVTSGGLEIELSSVSLVENNTDPLLCHLYINGNLYSSDSYLGDDNSSLVFTIPLEELGDSINGNYVVEIMMSDFVVPSDLIEGGVQARVSCEITYIGGYR